MTFLVAEGANRVSGLVYWFGYNYSDEKLNAEKLGFAVFFFQKEAQAIPEMLYSFPEISKRALPNVGDDGLGGEQTGLGAAGQNVLERGTGAAHIPCEGVGIAAPGPLCCDTADD